MAKTPSIALSLLVAVGTLAQSPSAQAYCRTKTCDTDPSYGDVWVDAPQPTECTRNAQGCYLQGIPLHWTSNCLSFGVQRDGSEKSGIDFELAEYVISHAFETWQSADCGGGEPPSVRVVPKGAIECNRIEYNAEGLNANVFLFREDSWPYTNIGGALALTTVTYNVQTGEIYDADVELNSYRSTFTVTDNPPEIVSDLASVVTHEVGHFLGLSHSADNLAVMRDDGYQDGTTDLRALAVDDTLAVCEIYPPGSPIRGSCEPRHGFSRECGVALEQTGGCTLASPATHSPPRPAAFLALLAGAAAFRRARRKR